MPLHVNNIDLDTYKERHHFIDRRWRITLRRKLSKHSLKSSGKVDSVRMRLTLTCLARLDMPFHIYWQFQFAGSFQLYFLV